MLTFDEVAGARRRASIAASSPSSADNAAVRRSDQHPVHQRHDRLAEGRHAHPPQHPQQRLFHRRGDAPHATQDRICIPVPLYHCFGMVLGNLACVTHGVGDGLSRREASIRWPCSRPSQAERCTGLYGVPTMFIAELDHPRLQRVRSELAAHRHHGRLALSDRGHEARRQRDAHARGHHLLRHDRDQPGQLPELGRRSDRAPRRHRRSHPSPCRGQDRRRRGPYRAARRAGRTLHARLFGHAGYWDDPEHTRGSDRRRRAGCIPAIWRRSTPRAIATSSDASRTWSSAAARISIRARSRNSSTAIPKIRTFR